MIERALWLSVTPEPERELPVAVARSSAAPPPARRALARLQASANEAR